MRRIPYVDFPAQYAEEESAIRDCVERVFRRGDFVGGAAVAALEKDLAAFCGVDHAVALNSGTDALVLAMVAAGIGPGDQVITPPNSFVASTAAIVQVGATPVFADVRDDQNIDPAAVARVIGPDTKAIMPVHLTGRVADMKPLKELAAQHGLILIEDAAQAFGSEYRGAKAGALGDIGCFSAHPLKNLNAAGDAGFITTNDGDLAARVARLRNHGMLDRDTVLEFGAVSRMDTLQAEILRLRLANLTSVVERRRRNAEVYQRKFLGSPVFAPPCRDYEFNTFHTFVVQVDRRDDLKDWLADRGIETAIHYPRPIHLQPAAEGLGFGPGDMPVAEAQAERILSLPIHQFLTPDDISYVADSVLRFCTAGRAQVATG